MIGEPINCYRCGKPGHVDWLDASSLGEGRGTSLIPGEQYCLTPDCKDEDGSRRLTPLSPAEMRRRADEAWLAHQEAMTE